MNLKTGKIRISKKVMCVILSLIIAFGTFVTITFGSSFFQKWFGVQSMLSAYAAEIVNTDGVVGVNEEAMRADDHTISLENQDGSNTVYIFTEPISFIDSNGDLKTKDITVENASSSLKKKGYEYTNGKNDFRINFSEDKDKGIQIAYNDISFSIIPKSEIAVEGKESVAEFLSENFEVFQYKNIYGNGTNLRYYPQLNGVKDEIVLNQNINKNSFSFELVTENCTAKLNDDGTVSLVDKSGMPVHTFDAPYAYDSLHKEGEENEHIINCKYSLTEHTSNSYLLSIYVDRGWLESSNTVYPVIIDPVTEHLSQNKDTYVRSSNANTNYGSAQSLCLGKTSSNGKARVFTHFSIPSEIHDYATIKSAAQWERETSGGTATTNVCAYLVDNTWTEDTLKWNNQPGIDPDVAPTPDKNLNSQSTDKPDYPLWYKFNITGIVQAIIGEDNDNKNNYGLVFKAKCEDNSYERWKTFASREYSSSSYRPYTVISYTNDTTAPTITDITRNPTGWSTGSVSYTVVANDAASDLASKAYGYSYDNSNNVNWQSSNVITVNTYDRIVYFKVRDRAGNIATTTRRTYVDKTAPSVPELSGVPENWVNHDITVTATSSEEEDEDVENESYGKTWINGYSFSLNENVTNFTSANSKTYTEYSNIYVYSRDWAGNISEDCEEAEILIDKDAPLFETVIEYNETNGNYDVTVEAEDVNGNHEECAGISGYRKNNNEDWVETEEESYTFTNIDNPNTLQISVKDNAGNIATQSPEITAPVIYQDGKFVKIINPNHHNLRLQYKVNNGNYADYSEPIELADNTETAIEARFYGTDINATGTFTYAPLPETVPYEEEITDLTVENNDVSFDVSRQYNSNEEEWHFSTQSNVSVVQANCVYRVVLPDEEPMIFALNEDFEIENEDTGYTLTVDNDNSQYIIDCDGTAFCYNLSTGRLKTVAENGHSINFEYTDGALTGISATEGTVTHSYTVNESNGKINHIITPLGEKLAYHYTIDGLVKVCYDKGTLQFGRTDDIILGEYEYLNNRLSKSNGNTVNYENGNYVSVTTPAGETISNESEPTEPETPEEEPEAVELDFSSDYPVFYEGTETIHYDKSGYTLDGTAYITEKEYNQSSQLITVTEQHIENYNNDNANVIYSKETTYFDNSDTVHTETVIEKENDVTNTTVNTYNESSQLVSVAVTQTKTNGAGGTETVYTQNITYSYFEGTDTVHTETVTETGNGNSTTTVTTYDTNSRVVSENIDGNTTSYEYDVWGNVETETNTKLENGIDVPVSSTAYVYDDLNRCIKETLSVPNETDAITLYAYNPLGEIIYEKSGNEVIRTLYDKYGRVIQKIESQDYSASDDGLSVNSNNVVIGTDSYANGNVGHRYVYDTDTRLLTKETNRLDVETTYTYHENSSVVATETFDIYRYEYNTDGDFENIKLQNGSSLITYAHYVYDNNKNNTQIQYANGQTILFEYNDGHKVVTKSFLDNGSSNAVLQTRYGYNGDELLYELDLVNHCTRWYDVADTVETTTVAYNNENQLIKGDLIYRSEKTTSDDEQTVSFNKSLYGTDILNADITENSDDIASHLGEFTVDYTKNDDGKLTGKTVTRKNASNAVIQYTYSHNVSDNTMSYTVTTPSYSKTLNYTYDDKDRITSYGSGSNDMVYYHYTDASNPAEQLYRVDDALDNQTYKYVYDTRGNIQEQKSYNYTTGTQLTGNNPEEDIEYTYTYDNKVWIDGVEVVSDGNNEENSYVYDDNGNPISIDSLNYHWTNARQLSSITYEEDETEKTFVSYTYDDDGIRTSKTFGDTTTYYLTDDGVITAQYEITHNANNEPVVTNLMEFLYDGSDELIGFSYNNAEYFYLKNLQEDVTDIVDTSGNVIVSYHYNAWGVPTVTDNTQEGLGTLNPMRYRGYYYDEETSYYYLQSRYYAPKWCKFLNSDIPTIAQLCKNEQFGLNLFAYCCNEPIANVDFTGYWGADIHYGRAKQKNPQYDGTYEWAINSGFKETYAESIANGDLDVDKNPNTSPVVGNGSLAKRQRFHFNRNKKGETDSRIEEGDKFFAESLEKYEKTKEKYNKKLKILNNKYENVFCKERNKNYKKELSALKNNRKKGYKSACFILGKALHCYQDIQAHGNISAGPVFENPLRLSGHAIIFTSEFKGADDPYRDWKNIKRTKVGKRQKHLSHRYELTRMNTRISIIIFLCEINYDNVIYSKKLDQWESIYEKQ